MLQRWLSWTGPEPRSDHVATCVKVCVAPHAVGGADRLAACKELCYSRRSIADDLARRAASAADLNETKKKRSQMGLLDEQGKTIEGALQQRMRWKRDSADLLEGAAVCRDDAAASEQQSLQIGSVKLHASSVEEIAAAVSRRGSGRAPGEDGLVVDLLKVDVKGRAKLIEPLLAKTHEQGAQPWAWRGGVLHELWKGLGSVNELKFLSWSVFVDVMAKCYHGLLHQKFVPYLAEFSPVSQAGSLPHRGTLHAMLNLRSLLQYCRGHKLSTACLFLDVKAAFARVNFSRSLRCVPLRL